MVEDTLQFGPEWLRNLSGGNSLKSPPPSPALPKYKLATHRYGREEFLALYDQKVDIPDELRQHPPILVDETQQPMAILPPTDEEQRLLSSSVNSIAVLRTTGRGSVPSMRGGRGGGERGRGRGRGEGYYQTRAGYEEEGSFGRARIQNRSESWDESPREYPPPTRGGFTPRGFGNGEGPPLQPRREFSRSMSSDNWRENRQLEEPEQDPNNEGGDWRRIGPKDRWGNRGTFDSRYEGYSPRERKTSYNERTYRRSTSESYEEEMPDWATADATEELGTFDSSGAFMSLKDGLDDVNSKVKNAKEMNEKDKDKRRESPKSVTNGAKNLNKEDSVEKEMMYDKQKKKESQSRESDNANNNHNKQYEPKLSAFTAREQTTMPPSSSNVDEKFKVANNNKEMGENAFTYQLSQDTVRNPVINNTSLDSSIEDNFDHLEKAAENLVDTLSTEEEELSEPVREQPQAERGTAVPLDHEDSKNWFYKDPQGELQGPFLASEMAEWFSAGYFTMNLLVKRGCDERFQPLGDLIKRWARVPFLPGPSPPPLLNVGVIGSKAATDSATSAAAAGSGHTSPTQQEQIQLKLIQQQMMVQQQQQFMHQQAFIRQMQAHQQALQSLQQQETFSHLSPADQQIAVQQLVVKHQEKQQKEIQAFQLLQQLQSPEVFAQVSAAQQQQKLLQILKLEELKRKQDKENFIVQISARLQQEDGFNKLAPTQLQALALQLWIKKQQVEQQQASSQKLSPRSEAVNLQRSVSQQPNDATHPMFNKSLSQPGPDEQGATGSNWSSEGSWNTSGSVWDVDSPQQKTSMEEIQRAERERAIKAKEEQQRREAEIRQQKEEEERRRQEEARKMEELRIKEEARRQEEMRIKEEARRQEEAKRQEEMRRRLEEEMERQRQIELQRQKEERNRQQMEKELQRQLGDHQLDMQRQMEIQRQQEIQRRQEMQQQQEYARQQDQLRRLQQEQMAKVQLPQTAQWASSSGMNTGTTSSLSMTHIQQLQEEKEMKERQRRLEIQRQQLQVIAAQQAVQQSGGGWGAQQVNQQQSEVKSLIEIQQEQERLERERQKQAGRQPGNQPQKIQPLSTAAVWSNASGANWANEGAWGNAQRAAGGGFWEDVMNAPKPSANKSFPTLNNQQSPHQSKAKNAKTKKEEETVQRLFQASMKSQTDAFTEWCEDALGNMNTSVDIPTFVSFLRDVESPYEIQDYVRSYLGDNMDARSFAHEFLEKRIQYRSELKNAEQEENMWGPAPAVNPRQKTLAMETEAQKQAKKKKSKKMQKLDPTMLGFVAQASPDRVNVGEIETIQHS